MALINTSVPNLIQGVSQQPDATRFDGQCEEQENALSSVAEGLKKRPNTRHVARLLEEAIDENSFVHFINRSDSEKYVLIHDGSKLYAYNIISGTEATINGTTGGLTISLGDYLHASTPRGSITGLTIGDSTFLLNREESVLAKTETTPSIAKKALIFVKQGDYKKDYNITVDVDLASSSVTTPAVLRVNTTPYLYSGLYMMWRHRITSITVDQAGAGYGGGTASLSLTASNASGTPSVINNATTSATITPAQLTVNMDGSGGIGSVTVDNPTTNDYQGTGSSPKGTTIYGVTTPHFPHLNILPPTFSYSLNPASTTGFSETVTYTSGNSASGSTSTPENANSDTIALGLKAALQSNTNINSNFTISLPNDGNLIVLEASSTIEDIAVSTSDSLSDGGLQAIYLKVDTISDLPTKAPHEFKVKVQGDAELNEDDYYVEFQTNSGNSFGEGSWVETVAPDIITGVAESTMPHVLINGGENVFTIGEMKIDDRVAGDDKSNPLPSFVGASLDNMFFFKNRLGFLSKENIVLSESGLGSSDGFGSIDYNFSRNTVTTLLDSDPIDVSVASSRVTNLKSAKGFQENLILFSENGQFVLKGGDVLTPKTVSIAPATNFSFEDQVDPLPLGSYIYFPFTRGNFTGLREFSVNANSDTYDSLEVTEHVPAYIPKDIIDMTGTTSEDMIALLSANEKGSLYIYNYFWNNNQKVLSAWSKFTFTGEIRGIQFIESTLYAVITNNGETNLVEMPLESGLSDNAGYVTHLDSRVSTTVDIGSSTITLPYTPEDNSVQVYTTDGLALNCTNSGSTVTLSNPVSADTDVWVGIPYTMKYTFSEQLFKAKAGNGKSPSNAAKMMIRNGSLYYDNTSYFKVKVTPKFRDTYENVFTPDVVGSSTIGALSLDSGFYRFPVFTKPQDTTITIENESALPSTFQSAEFESFVHSRSNRYG
jgi:hypothetical protein